MNSLGASALSPSQLTWYTHTGLVKVAWQEGYQRTEYIAKPHPHGFSFTLAGDNSEYACYCYIFHGLVSDFIGEDR